MRVRYSAYIAASIDGRIAKDKKSSSTDWTSAEDWKFFQESLAKSDAVIAGHNTFKVAEKQLRKRNTIVFTSKVREPEFSGKVVFLNPEHTEIVEFLAEKKYKTVAIVGGPTVYDFFLKKELLTDLFVTIEPYVFSDGVPMFSGVFKKSDLFLQSVKKLNKKGTLLLKYKYAS